MFGPSTGSGEQNEVRRGSGGATNEAVVPGEGPARAKSHGNPCGEPAEGATDASVVIAEPGKPRKTSENLGKSRKLLVVRIRQSCYPEPTEN